MLNNNQQKLKTSLADAIEKWMEENEVGDIMGIYLGDRTTEIMTDSAFNTLLAMKDLTEYCQEHNEGLV